MNEDYIDPYTGLHIPITGRTGTDLSGINSINTNWQLGLNQNNYNFSDITQSNLGSMQVQQNVNQTDQYQQSMLYSRVNPIKYLTMGEERRNLQNDLRKLYKTEQNQLNQQDNTSSSNVNWGGIIGSAATSAANAISNGGSAANVAAGILGIPEFAKLWKADTTVGDNNIKAAKEKINAAHDINWIQDAVDINGAGNAIKLNMQKQPSLIDTSGFRLYDRNSKADIKKFKPNWWKGMATAQLQGAAAGSVGGPWGALGGATVGLLGSIGGLFGRKKRAQRAIDEYNANMKALSSLATAENIRRKTDFQLANQNTLNNGIKQQNISEMSNFKAYGGNLYPDGGNVGFKSELDWSPESWFSKRVAKPDGTYYDEDEAKRLASHVPEYNQIEQNAKANGTWLKMPDGSTWQGDPRSWIMMQSEAYKKNYSDKPWYTGQGPFNTQFDYGNGLVDTNMITALPYSNDQMWFSDNKGYGDYFADYATETGTGFRDPFDEDYTGKGHNFLAAIPKDGNYRILESPSTNIPDDWRYLPYNLVDNNIERLPADQQYTKEYSGILTNRRIDNQKVKTDDVVNWSKDLGDEGIFIQNVNDGPSVIRAKDGDYFHTVPINEFISQPNFTKKVKFIEGNTGDFDINNPYKYSMMNTNNYNNIAAMGGSLFPIGGTLGANPIDPPKEDTYYPAIIPLANFIKGYRKHKEFIPPNDTTPALNYYGHKNMYNLLNSEVDANIRQSRLDNIIANRNLWSQNLRKGYTAEQLAKAGINLDEFDRNTDLGWEKGDFNKVNDQNVYDFYIRENGLGKHAVKQTASGSVQPFGPNVVSILGSYSEAPVGNPSNPKEMEALEKFYPTFVQKYPNERGSYHTNDRVYYTIYDGENLRYPVLIKNGDDYIVKELPKDITYRDLLGKGRDLDTMALAEPNKGLINLYNSTKQDKVPVYFDEKYSKPHISSGINGEWGKAVYQKLVNDYIENYINTQPNPQETRKKIYKYVNNNNTKAMGGNLYTDLSPNMMSLWNDKQNIDKQKIMNQQMNFGLSNSFNQKLNTFGYGGNFNPVDQLEINSFEEGGYIRKKAYIDSIDEAERKRTAFNNVYRKDWGRLTPAYADYTEDEFIRESNNPNNPDVFGSGLSVYNKYKYRKFLNYPNKNVGTAYLHYPRNMDEVYNAIPDNELPIYKDRDGYWYLKQGIPFLDNDYDNMPREGDNERGIIRNKKGDLRLNSKDVKLIKEKLKRLAWDNEFYNSVATQKEKDENIEYYPNNNSNNTVNKNSTNNNLSTIPDLDEIVANYMKEHNIGNNDKSNNNNITAEKTPSKELTNKQKEYYNKKRQSYSEFNKDMGFINKDDVKKFQEAYNREHEDKLKVDGLTGDKTIKAYQRWANELNKDNKDKETLKIDGFYGSKSKKSINSYIINRMLNNNDFDYTQIENANINTDADGYIEDYVTPQIQEPNVYEQEKFDDLYNNNYNDDINQYNQNYYNNNHYASGGTINRFDYGGSMNGLEMPTNMQYYENGGTHEENPNGGIQVGVDSQGNPNLVEEGEFRWNNDIFSDRIEVDPKILSEFGAPKARKDESYANLAKRVADSSKEGLNDPITKRTVDANLNKVFNAQEYQKKAEELEAQKDQQLAELKNTLKNPTQGNPMYGNMKYSGMGNAATQQGVNEGVDAGMGNPMDNSELSNVNRSGNPMMAAYGGNLFAIGGQKDEYGNPILGYNKPSLFTNNPFAVQTYASTAMLNPRIDTSPNARLSPNWGNLVTKPNRFENDLNGNLGVQRNIPINVKEDDYYALNDYYRPNEIAELRRSYGLSESGGVDESFVKALQQDLKSKGYYNGAIDNDFGKNSRLALDKMNGTGAWTDENGKYKKFGTTQSVNTAPNTRSRGYYSETKYINTPEEAVNIVNSQNGSQNNVTETSVSNRWDNNANEVQVPVDNTYTLGRPAAGIYDYTDPKVPMYSEAGLNAANAKGFIPNVTNWLGQTNRDFTPDFTPEIKLEALGNTAYADRTNAHIGDYVAPHFMDVERANNAAMAQTAMAQRGINNIANNNRGSVASLLSNNDYNGQMGFGNNYSTTNAYNADQYMKAAEFNRGTNQFNANSDNDMYKDNLNAWLQGRQMDINATSQANQSRNQKIQYADNTNRIAALNKQSDLSAWADNMFNNIVDEARYNRQLNEINTKLNNRYYFDKDKGWTYKGDTGLGKQINDYALGVRLTSEDYNKINDVLKNDPHDIHSIERIIDNRRNVQYREDLQEFNNTKNQLDSDIATYESYIDDESLDSVFNDSDRKLFRDDLNRYKKEMEEAKNYSERKSAMDKMQNRIKALQKKFDNHYSVDNIKLKYELDEIKNKMSDLENK